MATPTLWPPHLLPMVTASASLTVTGTGYTLVPGTSITVVPHIASRALVEMTMDISCGVFAAGVHCRMNVFVNGVAVTPRALFLPDAAGERATVTGSVTFDMAKETSYTVELRAENSGAGATYTLFLVSTRYTMLVMPALT